MGNDLPGENDFARPGPGGAPGAAAGEGGAVGGVGGASCALRDDAKAAAQMSVAKSLSLFIQFPPDIGVWLSDNACPQSCGSLIISEYQTDCETPVFRYLGPADFLLFDGT
jgi:hypothetical protein